MPFKQSSSVELSNKDVVSFTFDNPTYDIDKPLFIDPTNPSNHYTYRTALKTVRQLIAGLKRSGVKPGDTVCIHSFNSLIYPLLILAIIGVGGLSTGTNPGYTASELSHAVKVAKVKFIFAEPEILPNMQQALHSNGMDISSLFILDTLTDQKVPHGHKSWRTLLSHGESDWLRFDNTDQQSSTVAQLYYTSGTTGLPKCAMSTHRNLVAEHTLFFGNNPRSYPYRVALSMPFFHAGIASQVFISVLKEGRQGYVLRRFELEPYLKYHTQYQLTEIFMVPPMVNAIVMSGFADETSKSYRKDMNLRSVRNGTVGAAPCSADLQSRFAKLLAPGATYTQVWGMTETNSMAMIVPWPIAKAQDKFETWGTVGIPLPCMTMKLVNEDGEDITTTGKGELCVKGPTVVKGYFENEKATRESWDMDGYFKTGDVIEVRKVVVDGEEYELMYVVERLKELIKVRGFQVAPAELEGALTEHPGISDAAVIGLQRDGEELPKAFVVRKEGSKVTEQEIIAHMKERLARYKQLEGGIEFVEVIPKLPSGKILKRVLREQAKSADKSAKSKL